MEGVLLKRGDHLVGVWRPRYMVLALGPNTPTLTYFKVSQLASAPT